MEALPIGLCHGLGCCEDSDAITRGAAVTIQKGSVYAPQWEWIEVLVAEAIQAIQELGSLLTASESLLPYLAVIQFA